jgi:hypothetical protein
LTHVNALTSYSQGDIDAVVDEERDVVCFAFLVEFLGCRDESAGVRVLFAVLDNRCTCDSWLVFDVDESRCM